MSHRLIHHNHHCVWKCHYVLLPHKSTHTHTHTHKENTYEVHFGLIFCSFLFGVVCPCVNVCVCVCVCVCLSDGLCKEQEFQLNQTETPTHTLNPVYLQCITRAKGSVRSRVLLVMTLTEQSDQSSLKPSGHLPASWVLCHICCLTGLGAADILLPLLDTVGPAEACRCRSEEHTSELQSR